MVYAFVKIGHKD